MKVALAGLGWWGKHIMRRMKGSKEVEIALAIDPNPELARFTKEHGVPWTAKLEDALARPDIQAVILATPHSMHTGQIAAVARAKKHVFCEKPLALTKAEAEASVAACKAAGVFLGIGHERRYEPGMVELRRLVREGKLGTIMHVVADFSHDKLANVPEGDWRTSPKDAPAAGMTAMGIHLTDAFIDLFGPIAEVYASTSSRVAYKNNGDVIAVHTKFASGATGHINAVLVTPNHIGYTVLGSEAWVELKNLTHPDTPGPSVLTVMYRDGRSETKEHAWEDTVRANLEAFARAAQGKGDYMFTDAQKVANIATLEAICKSVASNLPVKV